MALNLIKKDKSHSVVSIKLDEQEFHNIFKEYYAALCSFAFQYMEDADMSADIVQDVFAKLWQIRDDFFYLHARFSLRRGNECRQYVDVEPG